MGELVNRRVTTVAAAAGSVAVVVLAVWAITAG